ncbi:MAG TPA: fibronectin type III domain-containing protein, partial [Acidimicrobiales bacterium]|nr:fibronectin type III domain-containing protein [Acidimicrobiales bacterium]
MIRLIAEVSWNAPSGCPTGGCSYVTSSLISNAPDSSLDTNPTVPGAPTQLTPVPGNKQVTVNWSAPGTNGGSAITGYDVYIGTSSGGESYTSPACTASGSATSCVVGSLTNGTLYYITVEAVNAVGNSVPSNEESVRPPGAINLSPTSGCVGTPVTISGTGYTSGATISQTTGVTFAGPDVTLNAGQTVSNGSWSATFTVPNASFGNQTVTGSDSSGVTASATFSVLPCLTLSPTSGPVGTSVTISGTGYTSGTTINQSSGVTFDGTDVTLNASQTVSSNGTWTATFTVPNVSVGDQTVTASDSSGVSTSTTFDVDAITLSPASGPVGTSVTISGAGYTPGATISQNTGVTFAGTDVTLNAAQTVSSSGTWTATFTVPNASKGAETVTATDSDSVSASTSFTVSTAISLSTTSGPVGTSVTVSGTGFSSGATINHSSGVTIDGTAASIGSSNVSISNGAWTATFTVPNTPHGAQTVTATDSALASASASFTVNAAITLLPTSGPVGTSVTITGSGFTSGKTISSSSGVTFTGTDVTLNASQTVSSSGTWTATFTVPTASHGAQTVTATDSLPESASTTFTVTPTITVSAANPISTTTATANGSVNPEGDSDIVQFCYSTSSSEVTGNSSTPCSGSKAPASTSPATGSSAVPETYNLAGLAPGTTYYVNLMVQSSGGTYYYG